MKTLKEKLIKELREAEIIARIKNPEKEKENFASTYERIKDEWRKRRGRSWRRR